MRILKPKNLYFFIGTCLLSIGSVSAQEQNIKVAQNPKFEQMLTEKRKINASLTVNERYKIQVFSGDSETAKKTLNEVKKDLKMDGTIVFYTPVYKVWIGNFKTKIEAERHLQEIKRKYSGALLIKPGK